MHQMNLITLNIWGGHVKKPLLKFVRTHSQTDIFCFQEVYHGSKYKISEDDNEVSLNIFSDLQYLLPEHNAFFRPVIENSYGIGIFINKEFDLLEEGYIYIHENPNYKGRGPTHSRILQWVKYRNKGQIYNILNVHGLWNGMGKTDTTERIVQSQRIKDFMNTLYGPIILCGDFNLRSDTESIGIVEKGMNNLIKLYDVKSTRTSLYPKEEQFADYIFSSPEILVNTFEVLNDEVSDHSPLRLNFEITRLTL